MTRRRPGLDPAVPYDDLPVLPPAVDVETPAVLRQTVSAARALAELKGVGGLIPDQAILINAIPLQEAKSSSEIEHIVTTHDELYRATVVESSKMSPEAKEVLRYRKALHEGYESLGKEGLSLALLRRVCSTIRDERTGFRGPGEDVHIGNRVSRVVTYTPPRGGEPVRSKLRNLEAYLLAVDGPDPLVRMAVAHYQFEAIHPFLDGNGRTGRILNILYLLHRGLLEIPVLYLSRFLIRNKPEYYRRLKGVTEGGEWAPWALFLLRGLEETALWTTGRIRAIRVLLDATVDKVRSQAPKVYSRELVDLVFRLPYCKIAFVVEAGLAERKTASSYLQELERLGVLESEKVGREVIYKHPALLKVLTA
jgi:Fic family protein